MLRMLLDKIENLCTKIKHPRNENASISAATNKIFSLRKFIFTLAYVICIWLLSTFLLQAFGEKPHTVQTLAVFVFCSFFCASQKTFKYLVLPATIVIGIYSPIGLLYGKPSYQFIVSLFATTSSEASEFLANFPISLIIKGLSIPILGILSYLAAKQGNLLPWRNKTYVLLSALILILCGRPTPFFHTLKAAFFQVDEENAAIHSLMKQSSWANVTGGSKPTDYILVIGESVRRDFLNIYGYPIRNTPFLSQSNQATVVNGLTSAAQNTAASLRLMLTWPNINEWEPRYNYTFISLAKAAGYRTVWLSNQGYSGIDTPVTAIAKQADSTIFTTGESSTGSTASDLVLLKLLQAELGKETTGSRLVVLHMMGSHSSACRRVREMRMEYSYKSSDKSYEELACYLSTIRLADRLLEQATSMMNKYSSQTGRPFSILWFSDHGQVQKLEDGMHKMRHGNMDWPSFEVPLIKIDSDAKKAVHIDSFKSGLCFTCGLAGWMNIRAKDLPACNLFDGKDDPDFGLKERLKNADKDPAEVFDVQWGKTDL